MMAAVLSSGGGGEKWIGGCQDGPSIGGEVRAGAEQCPVAGAGRNLEIDSEFVTNRSIY
jgi:hypothetical protein